MRRKLKSLFISPDMALGVSIFIITYYVASFCNITPRFVAQCSIMSAAISISLIVLFIHKFAYSSFADSMANDNCAFAKFMNKNGDFDHFVWSFGVVIFALALNISHSILIGIGSYYQVDYMPPTNVSLSIISGLTFYNINSVGLGFLDISNFDRKKKVFIKYKRFADNSTYGIRTSE